MANKEATQDDGLIVTSIVVGMLVLTFIGMAMAG